MHGLDMCVIVLQFFFFVPLFTVPTHLIMMVNLCSKSIAHPSNCL